MDKVSYPKAKGHMLEVWAKVECPLCGDDLDHLTDEYEEDVIELHLDSYTCDHCEIIVTYISPADIHEYHAVPDHQKWFQVERG